MTSPTRPQKKRSHSKYSKKYLEEWEKDPNFSGWLQKTPDDLINKGKSEAYCRLCHSTIRPHRTDLMNHKQTAIHKQHEKALPSRQQPTLERFGIEGGSKERHAKVNDMKLSVLVACHASTRSIDHIGEMARDLGKGSHLENLRLHRTKCSTIIMKVIAPCLREDLIEDIGDSCYSVICDESTDIGAKKQLALCVRYYSKSRREMVSAFLGLIETVRATAEALYSAFKDFLLAVGLRLDRLLAIGTDGANSMCGAHHSLYTLLKSRDCPKLLIVRCVCHSLAKCGSYASTEMPPELEHMVRESRNWFSHSSVRKFEYAELYKELCGVEPPLLVAMSDTRWLAYSGAVSTHLAQYEPLKVHFNNIASNPRTTCPTSQLLAKYHNDPSNLLLLTFLKPTLQELTKKNLLFQNTYADVTKAFRDLRIYVFSVANRIIRPEALRQTARPGMLQKTELEALRHALQSQDSLKPLDLVALGDSFQTLAAHMVQEKQISPDQLRRVKSFCANFLIRLAKELASRLPSCIEDIEKLKFLSPDLVLAHRGRPSFSSLPFRLLPMQLDMDELESQWNDLGAFAFADICPDEESLAQVDIVKFWSSCANVKNGAGEKPLQALAEAVLNLLALPLSNAIVERIFSIMKIVKDRLRNRMCNETLNSILFVRLWMKLVLKTCCVAFEPTEAMLRKFNSRTMYEPRRTRAEAPRDARTAEGPVGEEAGSEEEDGNLVEGITFEDDPDAINAALDAIEMANVDMIFDGIGGF